MRKHNLFPLASFSLFLFLALPVFSNAWGDEVPYVPTPEIVVEEMLAIGQINAFDNLIDLGSGDGRIVISAAKKHRANGIGIEYDTQLLAKSREKAIKEGVANKTKFLHADLFHAEIKNATIITMYLLPEVNLKLRPRLLSELAPGTRIVSHDFDMDDWEPDAKRTIKLAEKTYSYNNTSMVYLWIIPAQVDGLWVGSISGPDGELPLTLEFNQTFQKASVTAEAGGRKLAGSSRLRGYALTLMLEPVPRKSAGGTMLFNLKINENEITGGGWDEKKRPLTMRINRFTN